MASETEGEKPFCPRQSLSPSFPVSHTPRMADPGRTNQFLFTTGSKVYASCFL